MGTSTARPVIAKALVEIAKQEKADYIAHGATGKGNDQVRFELGIKALAPEMKIIAPWRIWNLQSRSDEIAYLEKHGIDLPFPSKNILTAKMKICFISAMRETNWNNRKKNQIIPIF